MSKALIIFNPQAGAANKKNAEDLVQAKLRELNYQFDLFYLDADFEKQIAGYDFNGIDLVVAVGGDGTARVAARTILENAVSARLAVIPFGSANVIATDLGLSFNIKTALKILDCQKTVKIDVGIINNRHYFLTGFSAGYISQVVIATERGLKSKFGLLGYLFRFVFNRIKLKRIRFKIQANGKEFWIKGNSLIVFNAFNLRGFKPKKNVSLTDGILNLYLITNKTFYSMFLAAVYLFWHPRPPKFIFSLTGKRFQINFGKKIGSCQIDGDNLDLPKEIEIKVLPKALQVIC